MSVISFANAATHGTTEFISALKNPALAALLSPLGTEKLNVLRKLAEIFQGKITPKPKLESTETQTKTVGKKILPRHL